MTYFTRTGQLLLRAWWLVALVIVALALSVCAFMAYGETTADEGPLSVKCARDRAMAAMYGCYIDARGALHFVDPYDPTDSNQTTLPDEFKNGSSGEQQIPLTEMEGHELYDGFTKIPTVGIDPDGAYQYIRVDRQGRVLMSPESGCRP